MSHVTLARPDLYSQIQAGAILGVDRSMVRGMALALKLVYKSDPTRAGKMLDRDDMGKLADALGMSLDWEAISA
jgi:hypothetical protein